MGKMSLVPEAGNTYTAEYIGPDGTIRHAEIGSPKPDGVALHYGASRNRSIFSVAGGKGMDLELVLACKGKGILATPISMDKPTYINKDELPTGLYQALLVSHQDSTVVSERIFFIGADRRPPIIMDITSDSLVTKLKTPAGVNADCSVRIVNKKKANSSEKLNALTQLLLQSELRERIEDPTSSIRHEKQKLILTCL